MNKTELIESVAGKLEVSKVEVKNKGITITKEVIETLATKLEISKAEAKRTARVVLDVYNEDLETVVTSKEAGSVVATVLESLIEGVVSGEVVIPGIGKLEVVDTAARSGISKLQGKETAWNKPASKTIKLRLSKAGKNLVGVGA